MSLPHGTRIGPYEIVALLGAGGMGEVYRARDPRLRRDVALKVLPAAALNDPAARAHLVEEARKASALNHPGICHIYEVDESHGTSWFAMELVEGRSLTASIPPGGLPVDDAMRFGLQIADALTHAYRRGIIHRDLKSANVMITPEGRVKVLDFGLAERVSRQTLDSATVSQAALSDPRGIAGTLPYMAPEVLRGAPADARADVWALGVVLHEMAAGALPFQGTSGFDLSSAILRDPPPPLPDKVPQKLCAVIARCLEKDPAQRFADSAELRAALDAVASRQPAGHAWRARLGWALGTLLVAAAAWIGWLLRPDGAATGHTTTANAPEASGPARLSTGGLASNVAEANEYFERGYLIGMSRLSILEMRRAYGRALELDPHFAEARAEYAFTYVLMLLHGESNDAGLLYKAEEEARRALEDQPESGRAHSVLAGVYLLQGRNERIPVEVEAALKRNPNDLPALNWMVSYHRLRGDYAHAEALAADILARVPTFFPTRLVLGFLLLERGDVAAAVREHEKVVEQSPDNVIAVSALARTHLIAGDTRRAAEVLELAQAEDQASYALRLNRAKLFVLEGRHDEAVREMDDEVIAFGEAVAFYAAEVAEYFAMVGDRQRALDWLDRAVRAGDERAEWFRRDPLLAGIRDEPRFTQILESIAYRRKSTEAAPRRGPRRGQTMQYHIARHAARRQRCLGR